MPVSILCIAGPTASGKSARAVREALAVPEGAEIISVDSRQVYRGLDIGTEKITPPEMHGVTHYLIDIRDPEEPYSAGAFAHDAAALIENISARGKLPILVGGTHFYFDALLTGMPEVAPDAALRDTLSKKSSEELFAALACVDPERARHIDPKNKRRLIRALEIVNMHGSVPPRSKGAPCIQGAPLHVEWIVMDPPAHELRERIDTRLLQALSRGLIEEVRRVRANVGDERLNELGLEYRVVGEYLRHERTEESLLPTLSSKLWQYARRQKAWLRKLATEKTIP